MELTNTSFPHYESVQAIISTLESMSSKCSEKASNLRMNTFYLSRVCQNIFNKDLAQFQSFLFIRAGLKAKALKVVRKT